MADADSRPFSRVLLKISGESFAKPGQFGIDPEELTLIAAQIKEAADTGTEVAVVVGGGNIIRGAVLAEHGQIDQSTADYMGMLGTVINGLALKEALEELGQPSRLMSAIEISAVSEKFIRARALRHFEKGRVIVLAAGTGNPFFTTDTCAALRGTELNVEVLLKATKVDGVYSADPEVDSQATLYKTLDFHDVLSKDLKVMDHAAISLCRMNKIPIVVFNVYTNGNIRRVVQGEQIGTTIGDYSDGPR